jgi:riboflavin kinase/FMN adenylyltransferase
MSFDDELSQLDADSFINRIQQRIQFSTLVEGIDFALGKNRTGNLHYLASLGKKQNFQVLPVPQLSINGEIVSSSQIRALLFAGQVDQAKNLLGRYYTLSGVVVKGDGRGKAIKIPTANLGIWKERAIPSGGVYACRAYYQDRVWNAVTNIGVRPTFEKTRVAPRVEVHLLDFDRDIYGENIKIEFITRIRAEMRFEDAEQLVKQIQHDILYARQIFESY